MQVEVFFPNENERKEANDTGVNPIDGFIVISLTGVHIIHKGQVPCRLNIEKPTMWNRNTDLSCKPPVSFDHNPVFTEFSFMSDIELVRQEVRAANLLTTTFTLFPFTLRIYLRVSFFISCSAC